MRFWWRIFVWMAEILDFEGINKDVREWSKQSRNDLKQQLRRLDVKQTGELLRSLKYSVRKTAGVADRISFKFAKQGVFVEKGVGKSYGIDGPKTATALLKRARKPKPWFNDTMDEQIPKLAERLKIDLTKKAIEEIKIR